MKAIRVEQFGGPEVMNLQEVPDPKVDQGQVVVRMKAIGVNPVDTYIRSGTYARKPNLPYTPGADGAGVVESVGNNVKRFKAGDRVYVIGSISGTYAELSLSPESRVFPLPSKVSFAQGAAMGVPYGTAYRALFQKANARPGETLLVHGASGGVGTAAVQIARAEGMIVIGTGGTDKGRTLVAEQGAHHVFDHKASDYTQQVIAATNGRGVDVITEMLANVNLPKDFAMLAPFGRVVVIGNRGSIEINPRDFMGKDGTVLGMTLFSATDQDLYMIHSSLGAGLENGTLRPVIGREMPLADAIKAHQAVMEPGSYGKIVLVP
jgi:NADPH:quinone reductase